MTASAFTEDGILKDKVFLLFEIAEVIVFGLLKAIPL
jgi:hypothetical protein